MTTINAPQARTELTPKELVAQATELVPLLRRNARRTDEERRIPEENIVALEESGILGMFRPARYGGSEVYSRTKVDVLAELARGCASTAWAVTIWTDQNYLVGLLPEQAQDEVFADPNARVTATINIVDARALPEDGGFRVSGTFPFNSGSLHAQWAAHAALITDGDRDPEPALFLMPYSDMTILDDWNTSGLRGSESNTVTATNVFVPTYRVLRVAPILAGTAPQSIHDSPLYRISPIHFWNTSIFPAALGVAQAAYEFFLERLPGSKITYTFYSEKGEAPVTHLQLAEVAMKMRAARLLGQDVTGLVDAHAETGEPFTLEERARLRCAVGYATRLCLEAVEILRVASGAKAIRLENPMQRLARDIQALSTHAMGSANPTLELYGRVLCGLEPNSDFL